MPRLCPPPRGRGRARAGVAEVGPACGGGSAAGLTGGDVVDLVGLCLPSGEMGAFAGVAAAPHLAGVDVRDVLPAGTTAAAEGCSMPRPRGGRVTARRQRGRKPSRCLHFGLRYDGEGRNVPRRCNWRPPPERTVLVVNVGAHWVTICMDRRFVLYVDSYGLSPGLPVVREFLERCALGLGLDPRESVFYNKRQVQAWASNFCGLFSVLWTLALSMTSANGGDDRMRSAVEQTKIKFYRKASRLGDNDRRCVEFLSHLAEANIDLASRTSKTTDPADSDDNDNCNRRK